MRGRLAVVLFFLILTTSAFGKEVFLSITGKTGAFFTDARILNPSFTKDITVNAQYLPSNNDNTNAPVMPLVIPKRSMRTFDDAVQSMFGGGPPLGAIRLVSDDDFVAVQRIFQDARSGRQAGTLGQFVPGLEPADAKTKGVLVGLRSGDTTLGAFRTNWGGANPNTTVANVTFNLYDKNNVVVATKTQSIQPFGMVTPSNIKPFFDNTTADLTDAWISYESDVPVFIYGSVVDNGSEDPTFIPASDDSGVAPVIPPPVQKTATITAVDFAFTATFSEPLREGDEVRFLIEATEGAHGFRMFSPAGQPLMDFPNLSSHERIITLPAAGKYEYLCTRDTCGVGHTFMNGSFVVAPRN